MLGMGDLRGNELYPVLIRVYKILVCQAPHMVCKLSKRYAYGMKIVKTVCIFSYECYGFHKNIGGGHGP